MRSGWTPYGERRFYFTYILSNASMTLYVGMTNNLSRRFWEHINKIGSVFTSRYHFDRVVYFEQTTDVVGAIAREKQLKGWSRKRKIELVQRMNPKWIDLTAEWSEESAT
jgi:putative endonuclease